MEGTTIRAKRVINIIKDQFDVHLITKADSYGIVSNLNKSNIFIVKPKNSNLWPLKIVPTLLSKKFDIVICESDWLGFPTYWFFLN